MPRQDVRSVSIIRNPPSRFDLFKDSRSNLFLFVLAFALLSVFSLHNFDSIGQDIGRHLKVGEIIWQMKEVPKTNLFSFTEPNFPFINHHWLSEVIFYKLFSWFGFTGLILIKVFLVLVVFWLLFSIFPPRSDLETVKGRTLRVTFWPLLVSFLLSVFIFISRTEFRPEIFSFFILTLFLLILFHAKYSLRSDLETVKGRTLRSNCLWFLPVLELFWVNLHIYFFIGPFLILVFFADQFFVRKKESWKILLIGLTTGLATLANPAGIYGALAPFNILKEYGYSVVENQNLSFLSAFFSFNLSIFIFKLSVAALIFSFVLTWRKTGRRIFEIIISAFFIYAGFKMLRNLPLYALVSFPILAMTLTDIFNWLERKFQGSTLKPVSRLSLEILSRIFKVLTAAFLIFFIFFVANSSFYQWAGLTRAFGLSVPNGLERGVEFVKENKIKGPMFNNFDIGGYLIWRFYPEEKVFVDNRPEAYPVKFFDEVYKPMQEDKEKWTELSKKYDINFIFFAHTDTTPWGQTFLKDILTNPDWKVVYINEVVVILVKDNQKNSDVISRFSITENNVVDRAAGDTKDSNLKTSELNLILSRIFYNISWRQASLHFAQEVIKVDDNNKYAYLNSGLVHAYYTDKENQSLAAESLKRAIDLGLKDSKYYYILGVVYMNLSRFNDAKTMFKKAIEIDKNNEQAKQFLTRFFNDK